MAYKQKGFRNSPLKVVDFDKMTEEEKRSLHEQMKKHPDWIDVDAESKERVAMHRPKKTSRGSAY